MEHLQIIHVKNRAHTMKEQNNVAERKRKQKKPNSLLNGSWKSELLYKCKHLNNCSISSLEIGPRLQRQRRTETNPCKTLKENELSEHQPAVLKPAELKARNFQILKLEPIRYDDTYFTAQYSRNTRFQLQRLFVTFRYRLNAFARSELFNFKQSINMQQY